ncbi:MAG: SGNH/GDSL hydrolase family protein [Chitinophagales bacterium]|nr:SGNH/GDSL hydrolase family protein [Chitinophagales bacterium]
MKYTMLCLGDSYTIGEAVEEHERFPMQAVQMLQAKNVVFEKPVIIAKTGWTTDELMQAIAEQNPVGSFDVVTLLIGVNNQYRGRDLENYRNEFHALLQTAVNYTGGNSNHVFVISIPDWGVTPFIAQDAKHRTREQVAAEIDAFNKVNNEVAKALKVHYMDITAHSRQAFEQRELIAGDGLHPSGEMYKHWASELGAGILKHVVND